MALRTGFQSEDSGEVPLPQEGAVLVELQADARPVGEAEVEPVPPFEGQCPHALGSERLLPHAQGSVAVLEPSGRNELECLAAPQEVNRSA